MKVLMFLLLLSGPILVIGAIVNSLTIGVVMQRQWWRNSKDNYYVSSIYVRYLETNGALAVPIFINRSPAYYDKVMRNINGLLLPTGFDKGTGVGYDRTVSILLKKAIELNRKGVYFPVWGIGKGFDKLVMYFSNGTRWTPTKCNALNLTVPTKVDSQVASKSKLFANSSQIVQILSNNKVTFHDHPVCLSTQDFNRLKLDRNFTKLGENKFGAVNAVSIIESKQYPFFGTSFNPEENQLIVKKKNIKYYNRGANAIRVAQHFITYFLNEARKNGQHFANKRDELKALIYNCRRMRVITGHGQNTYIDEVYQVSGVRSNKNYICLFITVMAIGSLMISYLQK